MSKMQSYSLSLVFCLLIATAVMSSGWCELQGDRIATFPDGALRGMVPLNGGLWLAVTTGDTGGQVWFSDLTPAGTTMLKAISSVEWAWYYDGPEAMTVGNTVYFTAETPEGFYSFWNAICRSDGTQEGTVVIALTPSTVSLMGEINGVALLYASPDIWRSDGTESGTYVIKTDVLIAEKTITLDGIMYFCGDTDDYGTELWRTDGTEVGTYMVKDLSVGTGNGCRPRFFIMGDVLYFEGKEATAGSGVARTDGTSAGTYLVKTIFPYSYWYCGIAYATALGDITLFFANDYDHGYELWKTNGTTAGTVLVKDINSGSEDSVDSRIAVMDSTAYFFADDGIHGRELWKSNGTAAGTALVVDFPGNGGGIQGPADGQIYFRRSTSDPEGLNLYRSDGTAEGTVLVAALDMGTITDVWSQDGFTYFGWRELYYPGSLGRITETGFEWIELRDVALGVSDTAYSGTRPYTVGNYTYFCGRHGGLWSVNTAFHFVTVPYASWETVGDRLELNVECAGGVGALSYQWFKGGEPILHATDATFVIESLTKDDEGSYTCRVTDAAKTVYETDPAVIEVFEESEMPAAGPAALVLTAAACIACRARRGLNRGKESKERTWRQ